MSEVRYVPDYDTPCDICGAVPTVTIVDSNGEQKTHYEMCGPCTFGDAAMLDPQEWN